MRYHIYNCDNRYNHLDYVAVKEMVYSNDCLKNKEAYIISFSLFPTLDYIKLTKTYIIINPLKQKQSLDREH